MMYLDFGFCRGINGVVCVIHWDLVCNFILFVVMFYKKQKQGDKWFPRSFTAGTFCTEDVARRLSQISTVSKADTYAVLLALGDVLGDMMETGNSVKLDGLGTFYLVGKANGQGVDTPEEVSPEQFKKVTVAFIPEYRRSHNRQVTKKTLVPKGIEWIEMDTVK